MNSHEKLQAMFHLQPVKDRRDIPIYPQLITWAGTATGTTQAAMIRDDNVWMQCMKKTFDMYGYPDACIPAPLGQIIFGEMMPARIPGRELGENELFQFVEEENMDISDYKEILEKGWTPWLNRFAMKIQNPPLKNRFQLIKKYIGLGKACSNLAKYMTKLGVEPISAMTLYPLFDQLSLYRSFGPFVMDLYDEPDLIQGLLKKYTPEIISSNLKMAKKNPIKRMHVYPMRSSADSISPDLFDEFAYPYLKMMIEEFWKAGFITILHADGNWLPMLDRFLELPKTSIHFEFDGRTDMFAAYDIIGGHHSLRGDVPATMLAYGTPDEVSEYCEKLITGIGMKGGFMLGTGCEVPLNTKPECYKAMMDSVKM